jgi:cholesterol transport system auxiliary component
MTMIHSASRACRITAMLGMLALAGCSVLPKHESIQTWRPPHAPMAESVTASTSAADFSVRIDTPMALGVLDTTGIVVVPEPGKISTYKGARWSKPPALLVRRRLVDAFMAAKLPAVTTGDDAAGPADYTLSGDLRAFQSRYHAGSPVVMVRYDARLRGGRRQRVLASHSFLVTESPANTQLSAVVAAFGAADDRLAREVVVWTTQVVGHSGPMRNQSAPHR